MIHLLGLDDSRELELPEITNSLELNSTLSSYTVINLMKETSL